MRSIVAICTVLCLAACGSGGPDQATSPGCVDCVELERVAELDFTDAPTYPSPNGLLTRSRATGRWAFVDRAVPSEVLVFESDGSFSRVVGEEGSGPGEYETITHALFDSFDSLWVVSRGGYRADLYDSNFEWVRGMPVESRVVRAVPMSDGRVLAVTSEPGAPGTLDAEVTPRLAWISREGAVQPVDSPRISSGPPELVSLASDGGDRFWAAEPHAYRVWQGDTSGGATLLVEKPPDWFGEDYSDEVKEEFGDFMDTGGATILQLTPAPGGSHVWLVAGVPSSSLGVETLRSGLEDRDPGLAALMIDHVVQGISTDSGAHHAQGRFDYIALQPGAPTLYGVGDDGVVRVLRPTVR